MFFVLFCFLFPDIISSQFQFYLYEYGLIEYLLILNTFIMSHEIHVKSDYIILIEQSEIVHLVNMSLNLIKHIARAVNFWLFQIMMLSQHWYIHEYMSQYRMSLDQGKGKLAPKNVFMRVRHNRRHELYSYHVPNQAFLPKYFSSLTVKYSR